MHKMVLTAVAGLALSLFSAPKASAQMSFDMTSQMMATSSVTIGGSMICESHSTQAAVDRCFEGDKKPNRANTKRPLRVAKAVNMSFLPNAAIRSKVKADYGQKLAAMVPGGSSDLESVDLFGLGEQVLEQSNLPKNDAASSAAFAAAILYDVANGTDSFPDGGASPVERARLKGLRNQFAFAAQNTPALKSGGEALQISSDTALLVGVTFALVQEGILRNMVEDKALIQARAIDMGRQSFGLDLRDVDFTADGFVPRDVKGFLSKYVSENGQIIPAPNSTETATPPSNSDAFNASRGEKMLQEYLSNVKEMGQDPNPKIVAMFEEMIREEAQ